MRMVVLGAAVGTVRFLRKLWCMTAIELWFGSMSITVIITDGVIVMLNAVQYASGPVFQTAM